MRLLGMSLAGFRPTDLKSTWGNPMPGSLVQTSLPVFGRSSKAKTAEPSPQTIQPDLFAPRQSKVGETRFAVIGDPGSGTANQLSIARRMKETYKQTPYASVLVLGDNVYDEGEPWLFEDRIEKPYGALMEKGVRFFPILGNHDVREGYEDQQLSYWGAPRFYSVPLAPDVEGFAIDTTLYLPNYDKCYPNREFWALKQAEIQTQWLENALSQSKAKFKIVMGHYPIYSSGAHSVQPESLLKLRAMLEPIFVKHGVDLYLSGHEHHYERSKPIAGIHHIVSGAAGRLRDIYYQDSPPHPREKAIAKYHFMLFEVKPEGLSFQVLSKRGKVLDSGLITAKASNTTGFVQFA